MPTPIIPPQPLMVSIRRADAMFILILIDRIYTNDKLTYSENLGNLYSRIDMALNPSWLDADLITSVLDAQDYTDEE